MDWAALSYWIWHRVALLDLGAVSTGQCEEGHRDLQVNECLVLCVGVPASCRAEEWLAEQRCLRRLLACMGQGCSRCDGTVSVVFDLGSINLISVSLTQWLPHTWNVSSSRSGQWAGPERPSGGNEHSELQCSESTKALQVQIQVHARDFKAGGFWGG